jgi:hypothetical protein
VQGEDLAILVRVTEDPEAEPLGDLLAGLDGPVEPELEQAAAQLATPRPLPYDLDAVALQHLVH